MSEVVTCTTRGRERPGTGLMRRFLRNALMAGGKLPGVPMSRRPAGSAGRSYGRCGSRFRYRVAAPMPRIYLSPPDVGEEERKLLLDAFDSNWIAPLGPHVDAFEADLARVAQVPAALALSSGTAALHLALLLLGVAPGDDVLVPSQTFVASANVVTYVGARPVLVDSNPTTWTIDPDLVAAELETRARQGRLPAALITVDLYGQCADYDR